MEKKSKRIRNLLCLLLIGILLIGCSGCSGTAGSPTEAAPPDGEQSSAVRTIAMKEFIEAEPRILIIEKAKNIGKDNEIDRIYILRDGKIIEKKTVAGESYRSLDELQELGGEEWAAYLGSIKPITMGELARMDEETLWKYVESLETERETALTYQLFTDASGNSAARETLGDLAEGKMININGATMGSSSRPIYNRYFCGISVLQPRERNGFFFLTNEEVTIVMDSPGTPGITVH